MKKTMVLCAVLFLCSWAAVAQEMEMVKTDMPSRVEGMFMRSNFTQGTDPVFADAFADELEGTLPMLWKVVKNNAHSR